METLYRRPLPDLAIPFASDEGRRLFAEALAALTAEASTSAVLTAELDQRAAQSQAMRALAGTAAARDACATCAP